MTWLLKIYYNLVKFFFKDVIFKKKSHPLQVSLFHILAFVDVFIKIKVIQKLKISTESVSFLV